MKIDIEYDGTWWDYNVYYEKRHLCGCASHLEDALEAIATCAKRITKEEVNPRRNP